MTEGRVIAERFRLVKPLGRGGMGVVWVAHDQRLDSPCAVKFLLASLDDRARARFALEAKSAAQLRSPNVVAVLDHGEADGLPYIAMELLEGEDLATRLGRLGALSPSRTLEVVEHVARALSRAHAAGLVHRDLKPANIFLARDEDREVVKVLDFGIAKASAGDPEATRPSPTATTQSDASVSMTATGTSMGTPNYMSPEQIDGEHVDGRTDLWALAVVAFECLTGRVPFQSDSLGHLYGLVLSSPAPAPSSLVKGLPPAVDAWFARALAKSRDERFASARELADALARAIELPVGGAAPSADEARVDPEGATVAAPTASALKAAADGFATTVQQDVTPAEPAPVVPIIDAPLVAREIVPATSRPRSPWRFLGAAGAVALAVGLGVVWLTNRSSVNLPPVDASGATAAASIPSVGATLPSSNGSGARPPQAPPLAPFVPGSSAIVEVAAGGHHTCARLSSGEVTCWGRSLDGQFGRAIPILAGDITPGMSPPLMMPGIEDATRVRAGMYSTCVLRKGGILACFGGLGPKVAAQPLLLQDVATFEMSVWDGLCVVKTSGKVHCMAGIDANTDADGAIEGLSDVVEVAVGRYHVCARRRTGAVGCWGTASSYQLSGPRTPPRELSPRTVAGLDDAVELVAGHDMTCARRRSDQLVCWGDPSYGQLGSKDPRVKLGVGPGGIDRTVYPASIQPEPVLAIGPIQAFDIGDSFACAASAGELRCWGSNAYARLGHGRFGEEKFKTGSTPPPPKVVTERVKQVTTGHQHACALLESGEVHCWGRGAERQLGATLKEFCEDNTACATRPVKAL